MNLPEIPEWWSEKFPHSYLEYSPIRNTIDMTVYFRLGRGNFRLDTEVPYEDIDRFWEQSLFQMITDIIDLTQEPDGWPGRGGHMHLIWADRAQEHLDKKSAT